MPAEVRLSREELRPLLEIDPWAGAAAVAFDWACIVLAIGLATWLRHPLVSVAAVVVVGARQHALLILMHEAVHKGLFRSARVRAWVATLLLSWPLGVSPAGYWSTHGPHHRFLNTDEDPDWTRNKRGASAAEFTFPQGRSRLACTLLQHASGLRTLDTLRSLSQASASPAGGGRRQGGPPAWLQLPFTLGIVAVVVATGHLVDGLLYWVLPLFTVTKGIVMFRTVAEHFGLEVDGEPGQDGTRTVVPGPLARFLLAPHGIHFHTEHHQHPGVRFDKLARAHELLREKGAYEGKTVYRSYAEVWRELTGRSTA